MYTTGRGNTRCDICPLSSNQCSYIKRNGHRCKNRVVQTNPFCWIHSLQMFGVRVKDSNLIPGQKGLFAERQFRAGELICPYYGDIERQDPDPELTEPYAVDLRKDQKVVNADCYRSLAANANSNIGLDRQFNAELSFKTTRSKKPSSLW